jgi:hypothetical protein
MMMNFCIQLPREKTQSGKFRNRDASKYCAWCIGISRFSSRTTDVKMAATRRRASVSAVDAQLAKCYWNAGFLALFVRIGESCDRPCALLLSGLASFAY